MTDGSTVQTGSRAGAGGTATLWDRLAHTPLRDALRGRWRVRRTIDRALDEAALPAPIAQLIRHVVRRTRLWRRERLEVAQELIAHFADGRDAGCEPDDLVRRFGSIDRAARLIRRGKKRNRPAWWRAWIRMWQGIGCLVLLCILVYAWSAIRVFSGSPTPRHDYLADLNREAASVPDDERAWPRYREALLAMRDQPQIEGPMSQLPESDDPAWAAWSAYVSAHTQELAAIREAAAMPRLGYVASTVIHKDDRELFAEEHAGSAANRPPLLIGVLFPHFARLQRMSMALNFDALLAAQAGDGQRAAADLEAMLGIAQHTRETPVFIADLVSFASLTRMLLTTGTILDEWRDVLTDAQLQALAHRIAAFSGGGRLQMRLDGERALQRDFIQHAFTDDGSGSGHITDEGLRLYSEIVSWNSAMTKELGVSVASPAIAPLAALVVADRQAVTEEYDRLMDLVERDLARPLWQIEQFESDGEVQRYFSSPLLNTRYLGIGALMPALSHAVITTEQTTQLRDAMLVAIALELYRRRHGRWPVSLDTLAPDLLPAIPVDRADGKPIKYLLREGQPVLYSVAVDRDDDGGRPFDQKLKGGILFGARWFSRSEVEHLRQVRPESPVPDGDAILWPPAE